MWSEHSLALPFLGIGMKTDLFQSCGHCQVSQICWHIEWSTFTESSFRIWNSSTGIPSPPLALFVLMLPKVHFISHSRMSGSRWVITPLWLSGSLRSFLYSFSYLEPGVAKSRTRLSDWTELNWNRLIKGILLQKCGKYTGKYWGQCSVLRPEGICERIVNKTQQEELKKVLWRRSPWEDL